MCHVRGCSTDAPPPLCVSQALQHVWVNTEGGVLQQQDLGKNLEALKKFNAARKLKSVMKTVLITNRMMGAFGGGAGGGGMMAKLKAQKAKEEAQEAEAARIEASLPDLVDRELAKSVTGDKYSEEKCELGGCLLLLLPPPVPPPPERSMVVKTVSFLIPDASPHQLWSCATGRK